MYKHKNVKLKVKKKKKTERKKVLSFVDLCAYKKGNSNLILLHAYTILVEEGVHQRLRISIQF
jgi:hypothetical protein